MAAASLVARGTPALYPSCSAGVRFGERYVTPSLLHGTPPPVRRLRISPSATEAKNRSVPRKLAGIWVPGRKRRGGAGCWGVGDAPPKHAVTWRVTKSPERGAGLPGPGFWSVNSVHSGVSPHSGG